MGNRTTVLRLAVVAATIASVLVPAFVSPARAITTPRLLANSVRLAGAGSVVLDFPATHLAFSWRGEDRTGVAYRTFDGAGVHSRWERAPEAHDLEHGSHHYTAVVSVDRVSRVQWVAVKAKRAEMGPVTLDYFNALDGPPQTTIVPATADAKARTPDIVTRAEWGADESLKKTSGSCDREFYPVQQLFVHHTAGTNYDDRPEATMRSIYWYHTVRRGWCDLGYNFVIGWDGTVYEGRWARSYEPWETHTSENQKEHAVAGAHTADYNSGSVGVSVMGNFSQVQPPPAVRKSLAEFLAWEADRHNLDPTGRHTYKNPETGLKDKLKVIAGHRNAGQTECPGNYLYSSLSDVRKDTEAVIGTGKASTVTSLVTGLEKVAYGTEVTYTGKLVDEDGLALAGRPVTIYRMYDGGEWKLDAEATTGTDGSFAYSLAPKKNVTVQAVYYGDSDTWGSQSKGVRTKVAPIVTIAVEGGLLDPLGVAHFPAGTTTVDLAGTVSPKNSGSVVKVKVYEVPLVGERTLIAKEKTVIASGAYGYQFAVPGPGTYEAEGKFVKDEDHAGTTSSPVRFVVDAY